VRDGKTRIVSVDLEELPEDEPVAASTGTESVDLGFTVRQNSEELARQYDLDSSDGVVIVAVEPGSEIQRKGVRPGDRVISIERKNIRDIGDFNDALKNIKEGETILVLLETRTGNKRFITVRAE
jgi:serine protease Do